MPTSPTTISIVSIRIASRRSGRTHAKNHEAMRKRTRRLRCPTALFRYRCVRLMRAERSAHALSPEDVKLLSSHTQVRAWLCLQEVVDAWTESAQAEPLHSPNPPSVGVLRRASEHWTAVAVKRHLMDHPDVPLPLISIDHVTFYAEDIVFGCTFLNAAQERCSVALSLHTFLPHYPSEVENALRRTQQQLAAQLHPDVEERP